MKKILFGALLAAGVLAAASPSRALEFEEVGVGVALGEPIGGTAKFWTGGALAFDAGAGLSDGNAALWADALWHDWTLLPQPRNGRLGAYVGGGPQVRTGDDARFGIRTVAGVSYRPAGHPLELFAEAGPLFRLTQGGEVDAVGGAGIRVLLGGVSRTTR